MVKMMPVLVSCECHNCRKFYPEMWVDRDKDGFPSLSDAICGECGYKGALHRSYDGQKVYAIIPPPEDGQIHRFEYTHTNEDGKKTTRKIPADIVNKMSGK